MAGRLIGGSRRRAKRNNVIRAGRIFIEASSDLRDFALLASSNGAYNTVTSGGPQIRGRHRTIRWRRATRPVFEIGCGWYVRATLLLGFRRAAN
jgi:hypothetical protein